jgi:hypothetical protein
MCVEERSDRTARRQRRENAEQGYARRRGAAVDEHGALGSCLCYDVDRLDCENVKSLAECRRANCHRLRLRSRDAENAGAERHTGGAAERNAQ